MQKIGLLYKKQSSWVWLIRFYMKIVKNLQKKNQVNDEKKEVIVKDLKEIEAQIGNIVAAIVSDFMQEEFKENMDELKKRKAELEFKQAQIKSCEIEQRIAEDI